MSTSLHLLFVCFFYPLLFALQTPDVKSNSPTASRESSQAELISSQIQVKKGEVFLAGIKITIPEGWHSYWSFAGDFGQAPIIEWKTPNGINIRPLPFPSPERKTFFINKTESYSFVYEKDFLIPFEIFIDPDYTQDYAPLFLDLKWSVCKEVCLLKEASLNLNLKVGPAFKENPETQEFFKFWQAHFPQILDLKSYFKIKGKKLIVDLFFKENLQCLDLFPKRKEDFSTTPAVLLNQNLNSCSFQVERFPSNLSTIAGSFVYSRQGKQHTTLFKAHQYKGLGVVWFILMAFLGGLILNVMPCVLPIIFLKFYNTLELKHLPSGRILALNLSYALGVIISFIVLALVIFTFQQTGKSLGWGFHLQSPSFVTFLALLFTFMALYLLNLISFSLPRVSLWTKNEKNVHHFMTGVLSTTAASPCTVPFMAPAVGFAFSQSFITIFVIFFFLGLGLSFPYLVLSFFPKTLNYIPTPGRWMEIVKKLLSIPLFLTTLWLLKILYSQLEFNLFVLSLMIFPLLFIGIFIHKLLQKIKMNLLFRQSVTFTFGFLILLILALQYTFHNFLIKRDSSTSGHFAEMPNSSWMAFDKHKIMMDKQAGKNVFVALGAEWCLTCKFNERIFKTSRFKNLVRTNQIELYYGDWTNYSPQLTEFLKNYTKPGVPFYIFFKGEEKVFSFPTLLFTDSFLKELKDLSKNDDH